MHGHAVSSKFMQLCYLRYSKTAVSFLSLIAASKIGIKKVSGDIVLQVGYLRVEFLFFLGFHVFSTSHL